MLPILTVAKKIKAQADSEADKKICVLCGSEIVEGVCYCDKS